MAFRPYFKQALAGKVSIYAAVGSSTHERGLYYAAPIYSGMTSSSPICGVVMAKLPGEPLDAMLKKHGDAALLLSPQNVVFASSREDWLYAMSPPVDAARVETIRKLKQFGSRFESDTPDILPFDPAATTADADGHSHHLTQSALDWGDPAGGWHIVTVWDLDNVNPPKLMAVIGFASGGVTLVIALMAFSIVESRNRHRESARRYRFLGTALATSSLAVAMTDTQASIQWVNPRFQSLTLYSPDEAMSETPKLLSSGLTPKATVSRAVGERSGRKIMVRRIHQQT